MTAADFALKRAHTAVYAVFIISGFAFGSWASRIPQVRRELGVTPAELGVVLLAFAVGSLIALPSAGAIVHRIGAARTITIMSLLAATGFSLTAIGLQFGTNFVFAALVLTGFGFGTWDVAMNVDAAEVERQLGKSVMSKYHAGFSVGTVLGAISGAAMNTLGLHPTPHLLINSALIAVFVPLSTKWLLPTMGDDDHEQGAAVWKAWREPRTILIGLFVLCAAFIEGSAGDWVAIAAIDGYQASDAMGSIVYGVFVTAMTLGRWFGGDVLDRYGRVKTLRAAAISAVVGIAIFIFGPNLWTAFAGTLLWGVGTSLSFPVGMSAAADQRRYSAARVSVVSTIGYVAFLAGPPLVGFVADSVGILRALLLAFGFGSVMLLLAGFTRPLAEEQNSN